MSHTTTITASLKDEQACIDAAHECVAEIVRGKLQLFDGTTVENGFGIQFKNWHYPVIIDLKTGEAKFDNFNGSWGDIAHLNKFIAHYSVHASAHAMRKRGQTPYFIRSQADLDRLAVMTGQKFNKLKPGKIAVAAISH